MVFKIFLDMQKYAYGLGKPKKKIPCYRTWLFNCPILEVVYGGTSTLSAFDHVDTE